MENRIVTIGRSGNQPFTINSDSVSYQHARIIIRDDCWELEDLGSTNGTFIRDNEGNFLKVYKKRISEDTIIRLGKGGHHSFTFMAHRVIAKEHDYSYEFQKLRSLLHKQIQKELQIEQKANRNNWIAKCSGIGAIALCSIVGMFVPLDSSVRYLAIAFAPILIGLLFKNDSEKLKNLRNIRKLIQVCPNCGRPLSDFDIENMQCPICKAK